MIPTGSSDSVLPNHPAIVIQRHFVDAQARLPATVPKGAVASLAEVFKFFIIVNA